MVFLAGPILGAANWQAAAIRELRRANADLHVANPRCQPFHGDFEEQVDWETHYLRRAAKHGCILFWLSRESHHRCDRAFAQTSRFELGEWLGLSRAFEARVVVGIEAGFPGERYVRWRLGKSYTNAPVCESLRVACAVAAELAVRGPTPWDQFMRTFEG